MIEKRHLYKKKPDNNKDLESFTLRQIYIIKEFNTQYKLQYLDFYTSKHMINNKDVFESFIL